MAAYQDKYMQIALELSRISALEGEVPAGAVIVCAGEIVGTGRNRRERERSALGHAEIEAIGAACKTVGDWRLSDCALYVTLEPCPMCAGAALSARLGALYYGADDPAGGACGSRHAIFTTQAPHNPEILAGRRENACAKQLSDFFTGLRLLKEGGITLRRFSLADVTDTAALLESAGFTIPDGEKERRVLLMKGYPMSVLMGRDVIAYGNITSDGLLHHIAVRPDLRGRGIGRLLCAALEHKARTAGLPAVRGQKGMVEGFFSALGFKESAGGEYILPFLIRYDPAQADFVLDKAIK